ncbi:anthranilate synthase component II [Acidithrix ferrooxidans]|uniref:Anthranilate synthase component 2 n=2 Tax=root TaxID=1 RepID=A0A0D8HMZ1_9ACTN|nr:aminodeoxychorismate/anthranilate synthase component II [Acidithrix ferrooxidans]KJF18451.1 anthranilate synthase component 2 [Acidithrix ferrooxidans]
MSNPARILMIDNYDSFVFNLVQYFGELGAYVDVVRNNQISVSEIADLNYDGIVISPGPGSPIDAGISLDLVVELGPTTPIFGVCLGHQVIGQAFGSNIVRAPIPMHGKTSMINHSGTGIFEGIKSPLKVTRYHSLIVDGASIPEDNLIVTATTSDGLIMAMAHSIYPMHSVQFHPESIFSESGKELISNFLTIARKFSLAPTTS